MNPIYARDPMSGAGAAFYGGRFNRRGLPALYCSLAVEGAVREINQVGSLQPTTLVCFDADIDGIFDTRDGHALREAEIETATLDDPAWRDDMSAGRQSRTQMLADRLMMLGHSGLLVRSFARGATATDLNLVLWRWGSDLPTRLTLIDDEGRLSR